MSEAPEKIWAYAGAFRMWRSDYPSHANNPVEYIRADVSDALVAAAREEALREAVEVCTNVIKNYDVMEPGKPNQFASLKTQKAAKGMVSLAREDILALITKDTDNG